MATESRSSFPRRREITRDTWVENVRQSSDGSPVTHLDLTELRGDKSSSYSRSSISVPCSSERPELLQARRNLSFRRTPSKVLSSLKRHADDPSVFLLLLLLSISPTLSFFRNSNDVELFHEHGYCSNISLLTDRAFRRTKEREERTSSLGSEDDSKISFNTVQLSFSKYYRSRFFHKSPRRGDQPSSSRNL